MTEVHGSTETEPVGVPTETDDSHRHQGGDGANSGWIGLATACLVAAITGVVDIGDKSFWLDEGYSYAFAQSDWSQLWTIVSSAQANMGIYYGILHVWLGLGDGEAVVRSLSALFFVATIPPIFFITRRIAGSVAGLVAGILLGVNAFVVHYGQEARGYSLVMFLSAVGTLLFMFAVDRPTRGRWAGYSLVMALAVYAHFFAAFVLAAHVAGWLYARRRAGHLLPLGAFGAVTLLVSPLIYFVLTNQGNQIGWIPEPSFDALLRSSKEIAGGGGLLLLGLYLAAAAWGSVVTHRMLPAERRWLVPTLVVWLLLPVLGSFAVSYVKPVFVTRYLIVASPALAILGAIGLTRLPITRLAAIPAVGLVVGLSIAGLLDWYSAPPQDDWRSAGAHIEEFGGPRDALIVFPPKVRDPLEYYLARHPSEAAGLPTPVFPDEPLGTFPYKTPRPKNLAAELVRRAEDHERAWVVLAYGNPDARSKALANITQRFPLIQQAPFKNVAVLLFDIRS